jgi:hypothetical protein
MAPGQQRWRLGAVAARAGARWSTGRSGCRPGGGGSGACRGRCGGGAVPLASGGAGASLQGRCWGGAGAGRHRAVAGWRRVAREGAAAGGETEGAAVGKRKRTHGRGRCGRGRRGRERRGRGRRGRRAAWEGAAAGRRGRRSGWEEEAEGFGRGRGGDARLRRGPGNLGLTPLYADGQAVGISLSVGVCPFFLLFFNFFYI